MRSEAINDGLIGAKAAFSMALNWIRSFHEGSNFPLGLEFTEHDSLINVESIRRN
jgi:hypothetical protein